MENKKSFWSKPEGFTGALTLGAIGVAGLFFWSKIVVFLLMVVTNTLYLIAGLVVLAGVLYVLMDPKFRNLVWYFYTTFMKKMTSVFIQMDPIAIMKTYLEHLKDKQKEMENQIEKLAGQIGVLNREVKTNEENIETNGKKYDYAKRQGDQMALSFIQKEVGRLTEANKKLNNIKLVLSKTGEQLKTLHKGTEYFIQDMTSEIRTKEVEYRAIKASTNAINAAKSIINGDRDKKSVYDESVEFLRDDMGRRVGEIENFMQTSASFIEKMDLQNGIYDEAGFQELEQMQNKLFIDTLNNTNSPVPISNQQSLPQAQTQFIEVKPVEVPQLADHAKENIKKFF